MEGGRLRRDDPPGPGDGDAAVAGPSSPRACSRLSCWEHGWDLTLLGWDFYPLLKQFSIIACRARALHTRQDLLVHVFRLVFWVHVFRCSFGCNI